MLIYIFGELVLEIKVNKIFLYKIFLYNFFYIKMLIEFIIY